ncbi:hypothetical protein FY134_26375 (plasmid) [Agrobacterium fabrum]|nr:hypothetical protein [Agrobacterium fabrum]UXT61222.1 hypothetical protein FY134_26375 [Agrobacterium fabrum]
MTRPPLLIPFYFPFGHKVETAAEQYPPVPTALDWLTSALKKYFQK